MEQMLREVEIECLPGDIPSHIDADVSQLTFGKVLRVSELPHSEKIKFLTEANQPVAHVTSVKEEVVAAPEAVAAEAAAPAEPEVIKKGKQETEEEGAEAPAGKPEKAEKRREEGEEITCVVGDAGLRPGGTAEAASPYTNQDGGVKLIVGLGNPGIEYQFTPHNLGFLAIDRIAANLGVEVRNRQCRALTARAVIADQPVLLAKPETFMNLSGLSVRELVEEYEAKPESDLIVIQDELDFPLGTLRIHTRRSSAGHNGIESIIGALGTQDFLRIRIGVAPDRKVNDGQRYLLAPLRKVELQVADGVLDTVEEAVKVILKEGPAAAMNRFNRKEPEENDQ